MINKDYILRLAERFGRTLAIVLHLRENNQYEEALITIDDLFLRYTGWTSGFINSVSVEMLLTMISPLGILNIEKCLWIAVLLKEEGDTYLAQGKSDESYYRYTKSLFFFLEVLLSNQAIPDLDMDSAVDDILNKLADYELPLPLQRKLFRYFEKVGNYAKAEDILFGMLEANDAERELIEQGSDFYSRLAKKSDTDLRLGNFSRQEAEEGFTQFQQRTMR